MRFPLLGERVRVRANHLFDCIDTAKELPGRTTETFMACIVASDNAAVAISIE
jgi:hypothetical protein